MYRKGKDSIVFRLNGGLRELIRIANCTLMGVLRFVFQVNVTRQGRQVFVRCLFGLFK